VGSYLSYVSNRPTCQAFTLKQFCFETCSNIVTSGKWIVCTYTPILKPFFFLRWKLYIRIHDIISFVAKEQNQKEAMRVHVTFPFLTLPIYHFLFVVTTTAPSPNTRPTSAPTIDSSYISCYLGLNQYQFAGSFSGSNAKVCFQGCFGPSFVTGYANTTEDLSASGYTQVYTCSTSNCNKNWTELR
jgi:hypothetical protein